MLPSGPGLACTDTNVVDVFNGTSLSWVYNWGLGPNGEIPQNVEYVPMLHSLGSVGVQEWVQGIQKRFQLGSTHLLSFNEPDISSQANLSTHDAAEAHAVYMQNVSAYMQIGSPAVSNANQTDPPMGLPWLKEFLSICAGRCAIDFITVHWYHSAENIPYFKWYIGQVVEFANTYVIGQVWLMEFGATGSRDEQLGFLDQAKVILSQFPSVTRYAWFAYSDAAWISDGALSDLGKHYIG